MIATVASFLPYELNEKKPGLVPEDYRVPLSKDGIFPGLLIVKDAKCPIYRGGEMPPFPMVISGEAIALAIVSDFLRSQLGFDEDCHPAVISVIGEHKDPVEFTKQFPAEIKIAREKQIKWCHVLVRGADDLWSRHRQHKTITDTMRFAARILGLTNKEWYVSPVPVEKINCPACNSLVEKTAVVCSNCKVVLDKKRAAELGLTFASVQA